MELVKSLILGLIQGLTEFLPVSSSGHLVLAQYFFGVEEGGVALDVVLHLGTLAAVIIFFWRDIVRLASAVPYLFSKKGGEQKQGDKRVLWMLVAASVPTAILGFAFEDFLTSLYATPAVVPYTLLVTAVLMFFANRMLDGRRRLPGMKTGNALLIGVFQGLAIMPGISRSGSTIFGALLQGFQRDEAARFSFLLSIPAILGATVFKFDEISALSASYALPLLAGFLAAAVAGYIAIQFLLALIRREKLYVFSIYCAVIAVISLIAYHLS